MSGLRGSGISSGGGSTDNGGTSNFPEEEIDEITAYFGKFDEIIVGSDILYYMLGKVV